MKIFLMMVASLGTLCGNMSPHDIAAELTLVSLPATHDAETFDAVVEWLGRSYVHHLLIGKTGFGDGTLVEQAARVAKLRHAIVNARNSEPLLAADQEGGRVQRIIGTAIPAPMAMRDEDIVKYAMTLAKETAVVGINLCLCPVLDIPCEGNFISDRAFGRDPEAVIHRASLWIETLKSYGLLVVGKHFPGHGSTTADTHQLAARVDKTREELEGWDIRPFRELFPKLDAIMSAHVYYPHLDPNEMGTYSSLIMTDLLQDFGGLRISDSLAMLAASPQQSSFEETAQSYALNAIKAINAGCDLVILGAPEFGSFVPDAKEHMLFLDRVNELIAASIAEGAVSQERVDEALARIVKVRHSNAKRSIGTERLGF